MPTRLRSRGLLKARRKWIAWRALGFVAMCNYDGGGNGKWSKTYGKYSRGHDEDHTGREHAADVANKLASVAASVRALELSGLQAKGDLREP